MNELKFEIKQLIDLHQEGGYWDFKQKWYLPEKKGDLLHDIICLANNLESHDGYIIIGVEDKSFNLVGVDGDVNRKNTQNLMDFLREKKFAGDIRPILFVETVNIYGFNLDIIVIKNSNYTPYYLKERFEKVNANNIYTRIQDTNTPIDKSADLDKVEYLWKKRFGLTQNPFERLSIYLSDYKNWVNSPYGEMEKYYKFYPEYTLKYDFDNDKNGCEYYFFFQTDSNPKYLSMKFYYHQTLLEYCDGISLDGGRYITPCPSTDGISFTSKTPWDIMFKYFDEDSFEYKFNVFLYNHEYSGDARIARRKFFESILIFKNCQEREEFKLYVISSWEKEKDRYKEKIHIPYIPDRIEGYRKNAFKEDCENVLILKKMLDDYRKIE